MAVLAACITMLPRLTAEEGIAAYLRVAVGTGSLEKSGSETLRKAWREMASPDHQPQVVRKPTARDLKAIGIKVVKTRKAEIHG